MRPWIKTQLKAQAMTKEAKGGSDWVKIHRGLLDSPLWLAEAFTPGQAWIDLIMRANWAPGHFFVRGNRVEVARGQVGLSARKLSGIWGWDQRRVSRWLARWSEEGRVRLEKSGPSTLVTVVNYDQYQSGGERVEEIGAPAEEPTEKPKPKRKAKRAAADYPEESEPYQLAIYIGKVLADNGKEGLVPTGPAGWNDWAATLDGVIGEKSRFKTPGKERYTSRILCELVHYAQSHDRWWRARVNSPKDLKKHLKKLYLDWESAGKPTHAERKKGLAQPARQQAGSSIFENYRPGSSGEIELTNEKGEWK